MVKLILDHKEQSGAEEISSRTNKDLDNVSASRSVRTLSIYLF
jgi:hypothetical protein